MLNPNSYKLFAGTIATNTDRTSGVQTAIINLQGMLALSIVMNFKYGSAGSTCSGIVQTSPDGGTTWLDIARADFTTATKITQFNLEGLLSKAAAAYSDLASEGVNDGILFDQVRAIVVSAGTLYVNTSLDIRVSAR